MNEFLKKIDIIVIKNIANPKISINDPIASDSI